jgi:hypothetical protein
LLASPVFLAWPPCFPWAVCWCGGRCSFLASLASASARVWVGSSLFSLGVLPGLCGSSAVGCLVVSSSFASFVAALPVAGAVSPVAAPVCPLASGAGVPASLRVGSRVVPSSSFLPVCSGVVSSLSWDARRLAVVAVVGGRSLVCLASGLGGVGSPAAVALVAALRVARASGAVVDVWGAPGSSGRVCPGYFCGVSAA